MALIPNWLDKVKFTIEYIGENGYKEEIQFFRDTDTGIYSGLFTGVYKVLEVTQQNDEVAPHEPFVTIVTVWQEANLNNIERGHSILEVWKEDDLVKAFEVFSGVSKGVGISNTQYLIP